MYFPAFAGLPGYFKAGRCFKMEAHL